MSTVAQRLISFEKKEKKVWVPPVLMRLDVKETASKGNKDADDGQFKGLPDQAGS